MTDELASDDQPPAADAWSLRDYPFRANPKVGIPENFYTAVGTLSKNWVDVEFFSRSLLAKIVGVDDETAVLLTSGLQSMALLETTRRAIHYRFPEYVTTYDKTHKRLNMVREYRNRIMHSLHSGGSEGHHPPYTVEMKVRHNKKGLSFYRSWKLAAHEVERYALLAHLLSLKLCDIKADIYRIREARLSLNDTSVET